MNKALVLLLSFFLLIVGAEAVYLVRIGRQSPATVLPKDRGHLAGESRLEKKIAPQDNRPYVVGSFQRWEKIGKSGDRYLFLANPLAGRTGLKIRTVFDFSGFFDHPRQRTGLAWEEAGSGKVIHLGEDRWQIAFNNIDRLVKPGDSLVVLPYYQNGALKTDENGAIVALLLILRADQEPDWERLKISQNSTQ